jgi:hypothetical protein
MCPVCGFALKTDPISPHICNLPYPNKLLFTGYLGVLTGNFPVQIQGRIPTERLVYLQCDPLTAEPWVASFYFDDGLDEFG